MLTPEGIVKVLDLGLARLQPDWKPAGEQTHCGDLLGTVDYMAPEQASSSHAVDIRADIYGLGCTLYKLLSGRAPFADAGRGSVSNKLYAHRNAPPPSVRELRPDVPGPLDVCIQKATAKDPQNRHPSPEALARELRRWARGSDLKKLAGVSHHGSTSSVSARFRNFRMKAIAATLVVLAMAVVIVTAYTCRYTVPAPPVQPGVGERTLDGDFLPNRERLLAALKVQRHWIVYTPRNYHPNIGVYPTEGQLQSDLEHLHEDGWRGVITISMLGTLRETPRLAKEVGFTHVIAGIFWFDDGQLSIEREATIEEAEYIDGIVVGMMALSRLTDQQSENGLERLPAAIEEIRRKTGKPVTTSEPYYNYGRYPRLLTVGDWVFPLITPCDEGRTDVGEAVDWLSKEYAKFHDIARDSHTKPCVVFRAVVWPTAGGSYATEENQCKFYQQLVDTDVRFVWAYSYDEPWQKPDAHTGDRVKYFGLYDSEGNPKRVIGELCSVYTTPYGLRDTPAP
jgi:exo-beta-1,3-glucanase (GH17 family)